MYSETWIATTGLWIGSSAATACVGVQTIDATTIASTVSSDRLLLYQLMTPVPPRVAVPPTA